MRYGKKLNEEELKELQDFYNAGNSIRKCKEKFGYATGTISKYVNVRIRSELHKKQRDAAKSGSVKEWLKNTKQKLADSLGGKCVVCGYQRYIGALCFHHIDPSTKSFTISGKTKAFKTLLDESKKCVLLCANCHAEVHGGLINLGR